MSLGFRRNSITLRKNIVIDILVRMDIYLSLSPRNQDKVKNYGNEMSKVDFHKNKCIFIYARTTVIK